MYTLQHSLSSETTTSVILMLGQNAQIRRDIMLTMRND